MIVYRHIRLDTNQPFYIGASNNEVRPHSKHNRNKKWNEIVAVSKYESQILFDDLGSDAAYEKEIEFIALYGRSCDGGILCNRSMGGKKAAMGVIKSDEERCKIGDITKGRKYTNKTKRAMAENKLGVLNPQSKLTPENVTEIRQSYKERGLSQREIGEKFGVAPMTISDIIQEKTWIHV